MLNRLRACWNVLRGRPTMYRMDMESPTYYSMSNVYIADCTFHGKSTVYTR